MSKKNANRNIMKTVSKVEKVYIFHTSFIFEVINIVFWQIWYFDVKGTMSTNQGHFDSNWKDLMCEWSLITNKCLIDLLST